MADVLQVLGSAWIKNKVKTKKLLLTGPNSLLIYLACRNKTVSRSELAFLYKPDQSEDIAQNYLRLQLHRAKQLDWAKNLIITEHNLELNIETDIKQFQISLAEKNWQKAINLYRGDFLEGLSLKSSTTYNTWLELERNQYKQDYKFALNKQLVLFQNQKDYHNASETAKTLLNLDKFDENALQNYLSSLYFSKQAKLAIKYYNKFLRLTKKENRANPSAATLDLIADIKSGKLLSPQLGQSFIPKSFLAQHTQFIGRKEEIAEISKLLAKADCRLLTIDGLGGTGKTRLVLELAEQQQNFYKSKVYFIALADLNSQEQILNHIAQSLELKLSPSTEAIKQITEHINDQKMLLILDNFEHLLEFSDIVSSLIRATNNLKIVVSSRARLNLQAEWLFSLRGLKYSTSTNSSSLDSEAVQLFINAIKRVLPSFSNKQAEQKISTILAICKRVDGLPLALEIAGSWLETESLEKILLELEQGLNILKTQNPEIPERQRSIQAVLDNSWQHLNSQQKDFLSQFSIFLDAANLDALEKICGANLGLILSLYNKSLIRRVAANSFEMHPLIKQYSAIKLSKQTELKKALLNSFSNYYIDLLDSNTDKNLLQSQISNINNIRYSWQILTQEQNLDRLEPALARMEYLHTTAGQYHDVNKLWNRTLKDLESIKTSQQRDRFRAAILNAKADTAISMGKLAEAHKYLEECFVLLEPIDAKKELTTALSSFARLNWIEGKHGKAQKLLEQALETAKILNNLRQKTTIMHGLAIVLREQNKLAEAVVYYQKVIDIYLSLNEYGNAAMAYNNLASLYISQGNYKTAQSYINKGLKLIEGLGAKRSESFLKLTYAGSLYESKNYKGAVLAFQDCLELSQKLNDPILISLALNMLGNSYWQLSKYKKSLGYLKKALDLASNIELLPRVLAIFVSFANLFFAQENYQDCLQLIAHSINNSASKEETRQEALEIQLRLEQKLAKDLDNTLAILSQKKLRKSIDYLLTL